MSSRHLISEKEKKRVEQEKLQLILNRLLKEEDNKYCADCAAKGPRWASWNLGVFLCIRCAGIHRNLGVHLSKVKSVNLDTWNPEQVQHMRVIGNSVGRAVYEASLPDHFRRPQTDSALDAFIRAKYEHKRYLMKDYVPAKIDPRDLLNSDEYFRPVSADNSTSGGNETSGGKGTRKGKVKLDAKPALVQKKDATGSTCKERVRWGSSNTQEQSVQKVDAEPGLSDLVDLNLDGAASTPNLATNSTGSGGLDDLLGLSVGSATQPGPDSRNIGGSGQSQHLSFNAGGSAASTGDATSDDGTKKRKEDILALYGSAAGTPAQSPLAANVGFGGPAPQQTPFSMIHQGPVLNYIATSASMWPAVYGPVVPQVRNGPVQESAAGLVSTPFGYVAMGQTQQTIPPFRSQFPNVATSAASNTHLEAVKQQLASLQLQRSESQQQQSFNRQQQDTLASSLWN